MAHMITATDHMAYAGEVPWHGLGTQVDGTQTPLEMVKVAKLGWKVKLLPMYVTVGGRTIEVADHYALTRMDTGVALDVVGGKYQPTQNVEALDFFSKFVAAGDMTMETCGSLNEGRRVWGLARLNKKKLALKGNDELKDYLLLSSPHMTGESLQIKYVNERVVCHNTYSRALREDGGRLYRMCHISKFDDRIKAQAEQALGLAIQEAKAFHEKAEALASVRASEADTIKFVFEWSGSKFEKRDTPALDITPAMSLASLDAVLAKHAEMEVVDSMTRTPRENDLNRIGRTVLEAIMDSPGSDKASAKGTWWGVFNGVTNACDFTLGREDSRLNESWFGTRAAKKEDALEMCLEYAGVSR